MKHKIFCLLLILLVLSSCFIFVLPTKASDTLIDSYDTSNYVNQTQSFQGVFTGSGVTTACGETFSLSTSYVLTSVKFYIYRVSSPTGYLEAQLYDTTGVLGSTCVPTGSPLGVSDFLYSGSVSTSITLYEFSFTGSNRYTLLTNHNYAIVLIAYNSSFSSSNNIKVGIDSTSPTYSGNTVRYNSGWDAMSGSYDTIFYIYGILASGVSFSSPTVSSLENGVSTSLGVTCSPLGSSISGGGYIFSWDLSGSYVNSSYVAFSTSPQTISISKMLYGTIGQTVHWIIYANDSINTWSVSSTQNFNIQATVTFYFTEGGFLWRNSVSISNGTSTTYTSPTTLIMLALQSSGYGFQSFNWSNSISSTLTNNYSFSITNQSTFWAYMNITDRYSQGLREGNATGYSNGYSDGYSNGYSTGYSNGYSQGLSDAYLPDYGLGYLAGNATGYTNGWFAGNATGYIQGYNKGLLDATFNFYGNATVNQVLDGYSFYGSNSTLQIGNYILPIPIPTMEETVTPEFGDGLVIGIIIAVAIGLLLAVVFWSKKK